MTMDNGKSSDPNSHYSLFPTQKKQSTKLVALLLLQLLIVVDWFQTKD